jgi:hypothetical protein
MKCTFELNGLGYIRQRESFEHEFKKSFHFGVSLVEDVRSDFGINSNNRLETITEDMNIYSIIFF